jgi:quinol monooxygenase YgiN
MKSKHKLWIATILVFMAFLFVGCNNQKNETNINNTIVLVKYKTQPSKENDVVDALTKLIGQVKNEPNFVNIKLHVDPKDKTNILLYEEWSDENYYVSKHMKTEHLQNFILESRNFLAGPPEITFWKINKEF